jgi:Fe-S cluster assembly protein SufD
MDAGGSMISAIAWYRDHFQQVYPQLPNSELEELRNCRQHQFAQFLAQGFPTRRQENWRYTDLSLLTQQPFTLAEVQSEPQLGKLLAAHELNNPDYLQLVFINGYYQATLSSLATLPVGTLLMPISQALRVCPQHVLPYLQQDFAQQPLTHFNAAFMTDGLFLYLPPLSVIKQPIHVLYISTASQPMLQQIRNIVLVGEQAQLTLLEQHVGLTEVSYWNNVVTQMNMAPGSHCHYYKSQQETAAIHTAQIHIHQQRDSQVLTWQGAFGAKLAREEWQVTLAEPNAAVALHGWYGASEQQHLAQHILINHVAPNTRSDAFYKGLAHNEGTAVFNGKIKVQQAAQKTQAKLTNKNLLLSNAATINTKPELEIYADDVKCAHGATVGQLDEQALFYLQARGIDKVAAKQLLIQAFAENMLEFISEDSIKAFFSHLMQQKLVVASGNYE